jgi:dolichol kinase
MSDVLALIVAFVYVSVILALGEGLRRGLHLSVDFTRKFVHIGVGMVTFLLVALFDDWHFAIIPPLVFIVVNYVSYRRQIFAGMETGAKGELGTVYFPISFSILIPLLWSQPALLVVSLMPLTCGDAFAAIIGSRFGRHKFTVIDETRSVEGSITMFAFSFAATLVALLIFGSLPTTAISLAFVIALIAALVEAVSPFGIDNLTVPLVSAAVVVWLNGMVAK